MAEVGRFTVRTRILVQVLDQDAMTIASGEVALTSDGDGDAATIRLDNAGLADLFEATAEKLRTDEIQ